VLLKVVFVAVACRAVVLWLPETVRVRLLALAGSGWTWAAVALAWGVTLAALAAGNPYLRGRIPPLERRGSPLEQVETWARTQTDEEAVFAVPPSFSGFRAHARRAIVVDFKAYPFQDGNMYAWFERLTDLAPVALPERGGPALIRELDEAYEALAPSALLPLAGRYDFTYLVRATPLDPLPPAFESVLVVPPWTVYRVRDHNVAPE
jgi:hypothetical protein